jgi:PIN domain nuclease of toxin-antitoxin system
MRYLLDTVAFLWGVDAADRLNTRARAILESRDEEIFLSPVVSWEIVIKVARGKLTLSRSVAETLSLAFERFGLQAQPITHAHTLALVELPPIHNDPFDRMLIAQAKCENLAIVTADETLKEYPVEILWCGK